VVSYFQDFFLHVTKITLKKQASGRLLKRCFGEKRNKTKMKKSNKTLQMKLKYFSYFYPTSLKKRTTDRVGESRRRKKKGCHVFQKYKHF